MDEDEFGFEDAQEFFEDEDSRPQLEEQDEEGQQAQSSGGPLPLHRAAWYNDVELLKKHLMGCSRAQLKQLDCHGNSALHVAAMRSCLDCGALLVAADFPSSMKNRRGWTAMLEAVEAQCFDLSLMLYKAEMTQLKAQVKAKRAAMLDTLRGLPDFSLQLSWELNSSVPGVGMLVRRYAPHDTYTIWKQGSQIRVDGSLMGIDKEGSGVLPEWKRGSFSLLYDTSGESAVVAFLNHKRKTWINIKEAKKKMKAVSESAMELEILDLMTQPTIESRKVKVAGFKFKPVSGWLHSTVTEKVESWKTQVYEGSGHLVSQCVTKTAYAPLPDDMSFDDYLLSSFSPDVVKEKPMNPLSDEAFSGKKKRVSATGEGTSGGKDAGTSGRVNGKWQKINGKWHKVDSSWVAAAKADGSCVAAAKADGSCVAAAKAADEKEGTGNEAVPQDSHASTHMSDYMNAVIRLEPDGSPKAALVPCDAGPEVPCNAGPGEDLVWVVPCNAGPEDPCDADVSPKSQEISFSGSKVADANAAQGHQGPSCEELKSTNRSVGKAPPLPATAPAPVAAEPVAEPPPSVAVADKKARVSGTGEKSAAERGGKKVSGRCWMAKDFPLSLHQLLPLLEVVGTTNKHIAKVAHFMSKYGDLAMFPVKVQVPLMLTVYVLLSFKKFKLATPNSLDASFFKVPSDYTIKEIEILTPSQASASEDFEDEMGDDLFRNY